MWTVLVEVPGLGQVSIRNNFGYDNKRSNKGRNRNWRNANLGNGRVKVFALVNNRFIITAGSFHFPVARRKLFLHLTPISLCE